MKLNPFKNNRFRFNLLLILTLSVFKSQAQGWTFPYPTTGTPCGSCVPPGWVMDLGSTDISSLVNWIGYSHYDASGVVMPVPEPTPGVTSFLSAMSFEMASTSFVLPEPRTLTIYFGGFGTNWSGLGPDGAQPGPTINVLVNGASTSVPIPWDGAWHAVTYDLIAGMNTIVFNPAIGDDDNRHAVHISIPAEQEGGCANLVAEPFDTELCLGDALTLEVSSTNDGVISWDGGIVNGESFFPPLGVTTYTATSDFEDDCDFTVDITVYDLPDVAATVDLDEICLGESVTFNGTGAETYTWDMGVTNGVSFEPSVAGTETYTVTGTDEHGCVNTASVDVTVFPAPTPHFEFVVDGLSSEDGGTGGCFLSIVQFNDLSMVTDPDNIVNWSWNFGDGGTSTEENPTHLYTSSGTYTVTLTITTEQGCTAFYTLDIIMTAQPTFELIYNEPTCFGYTDGSVTVNVTGGGGGELTFEITDTDGNLRNLDNSNTANTLGSGWYYIYLTDESACTGTDSVFLDQPGQLDIDLTTFDVLCNGLETGWARVDDVINFTGDYADISYFWNPNPAGVNGVGADSTWSLGAGNYTLTINDENGCSNVFDFEITEPTPIVVVIDTRPALCRTFSYQSGNGVVYGDVSGGMPDYTYLWTDLTTGETTPNTTWGGRNPGNYQFTVTDNNGCVVNNTVFLDSLNPEAIFSVNSAQLNGDLQGTAPVQVEFINESINFAHDGDPLSDTTFFWSLDRPTNGWYITHDYYEIMDTTYEARGQTYQIEVCLIAFNKNNCSDTSCKIITIYEPIKFTDINIFSPNGDGKNDVFTFEFRSASISEFECVIVNRWGVVIAELTSITDGWDGTDKSGNRVKDGVYFYTYKALTDDSTTLEGQGNIQVVGEK